MTTPKKGDLVIVREKRGAFKKDALYLAEVDFFLDGYFVVRRLSDGFIVASWPDGGIHTIEEVIPKEKLPKEKVDWNKWVKSIYKECSSILDEASSAPSPSLYPLEIGDEVEICKYDRATGLYSGEPGKVIRDLGRMVDVVGWKSGKHYPAVAETGMESGHPDYPAYAHVTRKHKPKQDMCNKKFEYKVGQKFKTDAGSQYEVIHVYGGVAYLKNTQAPHIYRLTYVDGQHQMVDKQNLSGSMFFTPIDPPLVAEAKELAAKLHNKPEAIERANGYMLDSLICLANSMLK